MLWISTFVSRIHGTNNYIYFMLWRGSLVCLVYYHNRYTNNDYVIKYLTVDISTDCWNLFQIEYTIYLSLVEQIQHILLPWIIMISGCFKLIFICNKFIGIIGPMLVNYLVLQCITRPSRSASAPTLFIRYTHYWSSPFLNNNIIIQAMVPLPRV